MDIEIRRQLNEIKKDIGSDLEKLDIIGVRLPYGLVGKIATTLSTAVYALSKPKPPREFNSDIKEAEKYYNDMLQKRKEYDAAVNYVIDEVLGLAEHPQVQAHRLAGGRAIVDSNIDRHCKMWYIDIVDAKKKKPLRIVFSHA